jgi:hypothetical protein
VATEELPRRFRIYFVLGVFIAAAAVLTYVACFRQLDRHEDQRTKDMGKESEFDNDVLLRRHGRQ